MKRIALASASLAVMLAGCFPVLIDVDRNGRALIPRQEGVFIYDLKSDKVELLVKAEENKPAWARWSPDGESILVAELLPRSNASVLYVVAVKDRQARELVRFGNVTVTCPMWSPDGGRVSVFNVTRCVILVVDAKKGESTEVYKDAIAAHRWLPDGRLLVIAGNRNVVGPARRQLLIVDPADGTGKPVAEVSCAKDATLDVSPDGKKALVAEQIETTAGGDTQFRPRVSVVDVPDGGKTELPVQEAQAAFWSPDGRHILFTAPDGQLVVTNAEGQNPLTVAPMSVVSAAGNREVRVLASWADDNTVVYFEWFNTYGEAKTAVHLVTVKIDGSERKDRQQAIDAGVAQAMEKK